MMPSAAQHRLPSASWGFGAGSELEILRHNYEKYAPPKMMMVVMMDDDLHIGDRSGHESLKELHNAHNA